VETGRDKSLHERVCMHGGTCVSVGACVRACVCPLKYTKQWKVGKGWVKELLPHL